MKGYSDVRVRPVTGVDESVLCQGLYYGQSTFYGLSVRDFLN